MAFAAVAIVASLIVWLGLATWVAMLADERAQPALPWFVVGLFLPIVSILLLLVLFLGRRHPGGEPTAEAAVAASAVARALADRPHVSVHDLVARTGLSERDVLSQLRALQNLGRVTRDDTGRFELNPT